MPPSSPHPPSSPPEDASTTLPSDETSTLGPASSRSSISEDSSRRSLRRRKTITRAIAFTSAVVSALCAGSITVFSLYGHVFQERLHYTQFQVNGVAIGSSLALYLPVSLLGYVCDRIGTAPLSGLAAVLFGTGYGLAAGVYHKSESRKHGGDLSSMRDWSYPLMVFAFVCIGVGTCSMYLAAVATCAKNFGKGRHRGLALAAPIAAFGLSGMWLSQVGSRLFYERRTDGSKGDVDVARFFIFLAVLLFVIGVQGTATLRVVDEQDLIEEAVEEMERSGLLDGSSLLSGQGRAGYGSIETTQNEAETLLPNDAKDLEEDAKWKKNWVLNAETRRFLADKTMWCFAVGFLLMIGPGEAFINNLGTVIGTLHTPSALSSPVPTSAATHVSIVGVTSTVARLLTGTLSDLLAPSPSTQHVQVSPSVPFLQRRCAISRVVFFLIFGLLLSLGLLSLASGLAQEHPERFWIVSSLVGAGYGAVFSLTPIIITVIWGVENFATNWGIVAMFPALGSTVWGLVYSAVYQAGAGGESPVTATGDGGAVDKDIFCYGQQCYAPTFWGMTVTVWASCFLVLWAWKGRDGWSRRGIVV